MNWTVAAAVLGALGVATGAFGAHALQGRLDAHALDIWDKAVRYQFWHVLALLAADALGRWASTLGRAAVLDWTARAGWCLTVGILLFSGSLYLLAATGVRKLGMVTPLGGVALIAGWLCLAVAGAKVR